MSSKLHWRPALRAGDDPQPDMRRGYNPAAQRAPDLIFVNRLCCQDSLASGQRMQFGPLKRREFVSLLGGAAAMWPLVARAQEVGRIALVGVLGPGLDNPVTGPGYQAFLSELRKLGFTDGQNVTVEYRRTDEGLSKAFTGATNWSRRSRTCSSRTARKSRCRRPLRRDP